MTTTGPGRGGERVPRGFVPLGRCAVMGVLNVTPDSFSDGGRHHDVDLAVEHGLRLHQAGADLIDIGGESTRPGAARITAEEECARVLPVTAALSAAGVRVSIDTSRSDVAAAAVEAGACLVNDVSGGVADPAMAKTIASLGVPWVIMHSRGPSRDMAARAHYHDVVAEVAAELASQVEAAINAGAAADQILLDPGLGFAKTASHNWEILANLTVLTGQDFPVVVGASRKSFLGELLATPAGEPRIVAEREAATLATTVLAANAGVWAVRVHDVQQNLDAVKVVATVANTQAAANSVSNEG